MAFVMASTVLVLLLQYHSVQHEGQERSIHPKNIAAQRMLRTLDGNSNNSEKEGAVDRDSVAKSKMAGAGMLSLSNGDNEINQVRNDNREEHVAPPTFAGRGSDSMNKFDLNRVPVYPPQMVPASNNANDGRKSGKDAEPVNFDSNSQFSPYQKSQPNVNNANNINGNNVRVFPGPFKAPFVPIPAQPKMVLPLPRYGNGNGMSPEVAAEPYIPKHRLFHLDLKGAPPKVGYLKKLFPLLKTFGATGVLLEYEDMFPYEGELALTAAKNHYSREEVKEILDLAKLYDFEVIPLVQTFGHMEFILKHREYGPLREVPSIPQSVCPSNNESMAIVEDMIDQVMALHPNVRWLHIGLDEVFQLGMCPRCMMRTMTDGRDVLFLSHVTRVATYVRERHNVIPIMWDDMLHHFSTESLKKFDLGNLVEIMIWTYVQDVYRFIPHDIWAMYGEVFPYVWSASAFKGAFGETLIAPPVKRHLENNLAWLDVMAKEQHRFKEFRGIAITGWQRYDHFATLCELLPASVPSLSINLLTVTHGYFNESWMHQLYDGLQCMKSARYNTFVNLDIDTYLWDKMYMCFFPGVTFFKLTQRLEGVNKAVTDYLLDETVKKAWLTEYNVRHNFSSISRIDASLSNFPYHYPDVENLIRQARDALREVYDEYTVAEWIEQKIYPLLRKLDLLRQTAESLKKASVWPARPLNPLPELQKYGIGITTDDPKTIGQQ